MPLVLGPKDSDKIAIVGSAPSSRLLAPWDDPSWAVWGCSPALYPVAKRTDVWFELHRFLPYPPGQPGKPGTRSFFSPEFCEFLNRHPQVFMSEVHPLVKNSVRYPFEEMLAKYGPYHFNSSISWILALAIECKPKAIGMFGIDMAAGEEYSYQRPGCQHFLGIAASMGIQIVLPPESDLMRPCTMYGLSELTPRHIKLRARLEELQSRAAGLSATMENAKNEHAFISGAIDNLNYVMAHWTDDDTDIDPTLAISHAAGYVHKNVPTGEVHGGAMGLSGVTPLSGVPIAKVNVGETPPAPAVKKKRGRKAKPNGDGTHIVEAKA